MKLIKVKECLLLVAEELIRSIGDHYIGKGFNGNDVFKWENSQESMFPKQTQKVIAYYPLTKEAKELDLPLLPNPFKISDIWEEVDPDIENPEELEVVPLIICKRTHWYDHRRQYHEIGSYENGKWCVGNNMDFENNPDMHYVKYWLRRKSDKLFSLEDIRKTFVIARTRPFFNVEDFIQSLSTQQLPKEFILTGKVGESIVIGHTGTQNVYSTVMYETITNSEGKQEICGTYKY